MFVTTNYSSETQSFAFIQCLRKIVATNKSLFKNDHISNLFCRALITQQGLNLYCVVDCSQPTKNSEFTEVVLGIYLLQVSVQS